MKLIFSFFLILNVVCFSVHAENLKEILSNTYETNPDLKASRERLKATDEQIMQSLSRWLPSVSLSGQKRFIDRGSSQTSASSKVQGTSRALNITQNLFRGGADVSTVKMAKAVIEQGRAALLSKEQEVLVAAVDIYMKVLQAEEEYKISEEQLEDSKLLVEFATRRFGGGEGTKTDVAQAKASLAEANSAIISASANLEILKSKFFEITGINPSKLSEPTQEIELPKSLDQAIESAMVSNPDLVSAISKKDQDVYNIHKVRGERILPSVDLKHSIQDDRKDGTIGASGLVSGAINRVTVLSVNIPVFDGGASWSQYRQAKRTSQQSQYDLSNIQNQVITTTTQAWRGYESKKYVLEARKEEVEASRVAYIGMNKEEKAGLRSVSDVINARNTYFNSYRRMINAKSDYVTSRYVIASKIGECTAEHLQLDVKIYDPLKNYNTIKLQLVGSYNPN